MRTQRQEKDWGYEGQVKPSRQHTWRESCLGKGFEGAKGGERKGRDGEGGCVYLFIPTSLIEDLSQEGDEGDGGGGCFRVDGVKNVMPRLLECGD